MLMDIIDCRQNVDLSIACKGAKQNTCLSVFKYIYLNIYLNLKLPTIAERLDFMIKTGR